MRDRASGHFALSTHAGAETDLRLGYACSSAAAFETGWRPRLTGPAPASNVNDSVRTKGGLTRDRTRSGQCLGGNPLRYRDRSAAGAQAGGATRSRDPGFANVPSAVAASRCGRVQLVEQVVATAVVNRAVRVIRPERWRAKVVNGTIRIRVRLRDGRAQDRHRPLDGRVWWLLSVSHGCHRARLDESSSLTLVMAPTRSDDRQPCRGGSSDDPHRLHVTLLCRTSRDGLSPETGLTRTRARHAAHRSAQRLFRTFHGVPSRGMAFCGDPSLISSGGELSSDESLARRRRLGGGPLVLPSGEGLARWDPLDWKIGDERLQPVGAQFHPRVL